MSIIFNALDDYSLYLNNVPVMLEFVDWMVDVNPFPDMFLNSEYTFLPS